MILPVGRIRSTGGLVCLGKCLNHSLAMKEHVTNAMIGPQNVWQSGTKYGQPITYIAFSIWIETPRQERLRRGLERDGEAARAQWEEGMAREDEYMEHEHPVQKVDLVLNGTEPRDLSVFFNG